MAASIRLIALAMFLGLALLAVSNAPIQRPAAPSDAEPSRLAVLVVFDQLRADYPERWRSAFGPNGFERLRSQGAWFTDCHFPYALTETSPGHATMACGATPARTGIVANNWYDRASGDEVYAVGSLRHDRVPPTMPTADRQPGARKPTASPERLLTRGLADRVQEAGGRVVALSMKDRSAVLVGGRRPEACYWFDTTDGQFVTSTYYRDSLHPWVRGLNTSRRADAWVNQRWNRLRPDLDYVALSGPDDQPGEGRGFNGQGRVFPHPYQPADQPIAKGYYEAVVNSPAGNELLLDLAKAAIVGEQLGRGSQPDFLSVSFSSNDLVGHLWGPDSQEVLDMTLNSDRILGELIALLDHEVGRDRYTLVLCSDHGVCPLPEVSRRRGHEAERLPTPSVEAANTYLAEAFGLEAKDARLIESISYPFVYVNPRVVAERKLKPAEVHRRLADWYPTQPGILAAYPREQLETLSDADDALLTAAKRSHHPERSGDVYLVNRPFSLLTPYPDGTTHGSPHPYDTHVPLAVYGAGVRPGERSDRVTPLAAAAILARALGLEPPEQAEVDVPAGLLVR